MHHNNAEPGQANKKICIQKQTENKARAHTHTQTNVILFYEVVQFQLF